MKFEGYHKIPKDPNKVLISIPIIFFEKYEIYKNIHNKIFKEFIDEYSQKKQIPNPYEYINNNILSNNYIISEKSVDIIGMESINNFINYITRIIVSSRNYLFYEELYRICVRQLLINGWPMYRLVYQLKDYPYTTTRLEKDGTSYPLYPPNELFIFGPHVPGFEGHTRLASLFAYIEKNGKHSKLMNEYGIESFCESPWILIENEDVQYLQIQPYEKVLVWFFIGDIGF